MIYLLNQITEIPYSVWHVMFIIPTYLIIKYIRIRVNKHINVSTEWTILDSIVCAMVSIPGTFWLAFAVIAIALVMHFVDNKTWNNPSKL